MDMWDERKFFDDYISETDRIKPDSDFVKRLKTEAEKEAGSDKKNVLPKYGLVMAVVLCIFAGVFIWYINSNISISDDNTGKPKSYAEKDGQVQSGESGIITLKKAKECISSEESVITDKDGNVISDSKKEELSEMLEGAVSTDDKPAKEEKYEEYRCSSPVVFDFKVYESGYIIIEETGMVYKQK